MICPETDKLCKSPECKEHGRCLEQAEDEGEEELKGTNVPT